ncbi:MAG: glycoside hydrolase family 127 protein [Lachnospiraceae bacterium]|nr:glycoside hydrolase family 127 protein [Lachnospiraceae bacterium]
MAFREQILKYDFEQVNSTIVADASGHGQAGVIRNFDKGGATVSDESVFGIESSVLHLPGGKDGGYLQFPNGILKGSDACTFSIFFKCNGCPGRSVLFSVGEDNLFSVYLDPLSESSYNCIVMATAGGLSQAALSEPLLLNIGEWYCLAVSFDTAEKENRLTVYINGMNRTSFTQKKVTCLSVGDSGEGFIGYGPISPLCLQADVTSVTLSSGVLSDSEIASFFTVSDEERVEFDVKELDYLTDLTVEEDVKLPESGAYGTVYSWSSSDDSVLTPAGHVTRPAPSGSAASVTLSLEAAYGTCTLGYDYNITVKPLPTVGERLEVGLHNIILPESEPVVTDLSLPDKLSFGPAISWESSDPSVLDASGKVNRPAPDENGRPVDATVTLTAHAAFEGEERTRSFKIFVPGVRKAFSHAQEHTGNTVDYSYTPRIKRPARHPGLDKVTLKNAGIYTANRDRCLDYLKLLDPDRMLYNFRVTFGQDTHGAEPLGGWDEPTGLLRGHSTGHFLSALALSYASTKDPNIKKKLDYMVEELHSLQALSAGNAADFKTACTPDKAVQSLWSKNPSCWGKGYLGAYSPDQFALLEQYTPYATIWAPYYTLHKILAGLIDCYTYADNRTALDTAILLGNWVKERLNATTKEQRAKMWSMYIAGEYGGMNESLATLALLTHDDSFLETAQMFDNPKVFDGLSVNLDTISGIHANQHIPQIIGALREYEASGDSKYFKIAASFWKIVTDHYAYSTGGVGRGEVFKEPDILAGNIDSDRNCETCACYNMLKLTRMLYAYDPDNSAFMDYYERGLLNQIAASQNPVVSPNMHNGVTYMLPIGPGAIREYSSDYDDFTCCHGTGMENHVKYQDSVYCLREEEKTLYINLYMGTEINDPVSLTMSVDHEAQKASLRINEDSDLCLRFRVPYWAEKGMKIEYNGAEIAGTDCPGGYLSPDCELKKGDVFTVSFPYSVRLEVTPDRLDSSEVASVCYGPFVMVALCDSTDWITLSTLPDPSESFIPSWDKENARPVLTSYGRTFIPMYAAHNARYHTYFKLRRI